MLKSPRRNVHKLWKSCAYRVGILGAVLALAVTPLTAAPVLGHAGPTLSRPANQAPAGSPLATGLLYALAVFGAIRIKDTGTLAKKFVTRAGAASGDYKDGVTQAGGDWEQNTKNSEGNFEMGVQQAIADKRFGKGVSAAGGAKYVAKAQSLGAQRYGPGVQASEGDWARGVQPSLDLLKSLNLPPKGPRRSPQNQARANAVAVALGALKVGK